MRVPYNAVTPTLTNARLHSFTDQSRVHNDSEEVTEEVFIVQLSGRLEHNAGSEKSSKAEDNRRIQYLRWHKSKEEEVDSEFGHFILDIEYSSDRRNRVNRSPVTINAINDHT